MGQLTLGDILNLIKELKECGMKDAEIKALPVYLGDDDELNGIHYGWYANLIDADDTENEDNACIVELMNDCFYKGLKGKAILIS